MNLYDRVLSQEGRMAAPLAGYPGLRITGRSVQEGLRNADIQLDALRALEERLHPDIVFTFLDPTVEAEALGLKVEFHDHKLPSLDPSGHMLAEQVLRLNMPDPESSCRMPLYIEVAEGLCGEGGRMCGAFVTGSFTLLARLLGTEALLSLVREEHDLEALIGFTTSVVGEYAASLAERVDVVVIFDPEVEALETSRYRLICCPYLRGLAGIIRSSGAICMVHVCGDSTHLLEEMALAGAEGICLGAKVDLPHVAEVLPLNLVLMGNIDPRRFILLGTPEDVNWEVRRLLRRMSGARNFILSTGCDVPAKAPLENLEAMMEVARSWRPRSDML